MAPRFLLAGLLISVAFNFFLLFYRPQPVRSDPGQPPRSDSPSVPLPDKTHPTIQPPLLYQGTNAVFTWDMVESSDYATFVKNLRAIGCPEETVRDIISRDLAQHYGKKKWELLRSAVREDYWKADYTVSSTLDSEMLDQLREMDEEFNNAYQSLLQAEPREKHQIKDLDELDREVLATYGSLPGEKLRQIRNELENLRIEASWVAPGSPQLDELQKETEDRIMSMLSPGERELYELRTSRAASTLRKSMGGFDLSEQEFLQTFRMIKNTQSAYPEIPLDQIVRESLAGALGPPRYEAYLEAVASQPVK